MTLLRNTCFATAAAVGLTMGFAANPALSAQVDDREHGWCNVVTNIQPENVIRSSNGKAVIQDSSYPCEPQMAEEPEPEPEAPESFVVYFDFDRSNIRPDAAETLVDVLETAETEEAQGFALTGHTDTVGSAEYNMALSLRRAESVRDWFVDRGVPANAISVAGRGFSEPAVPTGPQVREQLNRRVEIVMQ